MSTEANLNKNVSFIADNYLCCGCGACAAVCPVKAVKMFENEAGFIVADVDKNTCINCLKCTKICPSNHDNQKISKIQDYYGNYICAYVGYATDKYIRLHSQSGGVVTALLSFLIENKEIDGAYVNNFNALNMRPEVIFAKTKEELLTAMGSYYSQSSVSNAILSENSKNCAAVVLGCQAESIRLSSEKLYTNRPKYLIGLVCAGQNSGRSIDYLVNVSHARKSGSEINGFRYRSKLAGGWPGNVLISTKEKKYKVSKDTRILSKDIFSCYRCKFCFDKANVYTDIVCGDPWGLSDYECKEGNTLILVRTQKGLELIRKAQELGVISVEEIESANFFNSIALEKAVINKTLSFYKHCSRNEIIMPYEISLDLLKDGELIKKEELDKIEETREFYCADKIKIESIINKKNRQNRKNLFAMRKRRLKSIFFYYIKKLLN